MSDIKIFLGCDESAKDIIMKREEIGTLTEKIKLLKEKILAQIRRNLKGTFTDEEREAIHKGANIELGILTEPIPPVSLIVSIEQEVQ